MTIFFIFKYLCTSILHCIWPKDYEKETKTSSFLECRGPGASVYAVASFGHAKGSIGRRLVASRFDIWVLRFGIPSSPELHFCVLWLHHHASEIYRKPDLNFRVRAISGKWTYWYASVTYQEISDFSLEKKKDFSFLVACCRAYIGSLITNLPKVQARDARKVSAQWLHFSGEDFGVPATKRTGKVFAIDQRRIDSSSFPIYY